MKERLAHIRTTMARKGISAFYAWYSPRADFMIDTLDATEDILWMIAEIERLRIENNDLRSPRFSQFIEVQLRKRLSTDAPAGGKMAKPGRRGRKRDRHG
jgi:hypothetical protein